MGNWHYAQAGRQYGPVSLETLQSLGQSGQLQPADLVWNESLPEWTPAGRIPAIFGGAQSAAEMPGSRFTQTADTIAYNSGSMMVTRRSLDMLRQTKPWARFIGIMAFIGSGFIILMGLFFVGAMSMGNRSFTPFRAMGAAGSVIGIVYIVLGALYVIPGIFLNRYATFIGQTLASGRAEDLERALEAQKSFWKFVGILVLVVMCLYGVSVLVMVVGVTMR